MQTKIEKIEFIPDRIAGGDWLITVRYTTRSIFDLFMRRSWTRTWRGDSGSFRDVETAERCDRNTRLWLDRIVAKEEWKAEKGSSLRNDNDAHPHDLKPCPFCCSLDLRVSASDGIICRSCHAQVLGTGCDGDVVTWNRRPKDTDQLHSGRIVMTIPDQRKPRPSKTAVGFMINDGDIAAR